MKNFWIVLCSLIMLPCLLLATGCGEDDNKVPTANANEEVYSVSVENGFAGNYSNWTSLIKQEIGDKSTDYELRVEGSSIQWRNKTKENTDSWKDLISFEELKVEYGKALTTAFNLFKSKLPSLNGNYKVVYNYTDGRNIAESYIRYGFGLGINESVIVRASLEYNYNAAETLDDLEILTHYYTLNGFAEKGQTMDYENNELKEWLPTNYLIHTYTRDALTGELTYRHSGGASDYNCVYVDNAFNFKYVKLLNNFKKEDLTSFQYNSNGDCVLSFKAYGGASDVDYLNSELMYDFYITNDGYLEKCNVYEQDFMDNSKKGDLFCKISYQKDKSDITSEMFETLLGKEKEAYKANYPDMKTWRDFFSSKYGDYGTQEPEKPVEEPITLKNGSYKITTYTVDGESQTAYLGEYATMNDGTMTDCSTNYSVAYTLGENNTITVNWTGRGGSTVPLNGTIAKDSFSVEGDIDGRHIVMGFQYVADVKLKNGTYVASSYIVDGVSQPFGAYMIYSNGIITDNSGTSATCSMIGDSIKILSSDGENSFTMKGTISETTISIDYTTGDGRRIIMVLNYAEDVKVKAGSYKITAYTIDGASQEQWIGKLNTIGNGNFIDWLGNVTTYEIHGNVMIVDRAAHNQPKLYGKIEGNTITFTDVNSAGQKLLTVITYVEE